MTRKCPKFTDQIRRAIRDSGRSRYQIWKETGIHQETLSRFMHSKGGLSPNVLDRLAEYLGLELSVRPKRRR
jgi:hypothetical protein